jgi:hypothetical protein
VCAAPAAPNAHARAPPRLVDLSSPRIFLDPIRVVLSVSQLRFLTTHSSPSTPSDYKFELTAAFQKALDDQEAAGSSPLRPSTRQHHTTIDDQYNRIYVTTPSTTPSPTGGGRRPTSVHHHSIKRNLPTHPPFRESWVRGVGTRFSLRTRYGVRGLKFVIVSTAADWSADQTYLITYGLIGHRMLAPW